MFLSPIFLPKKMYNGYLADTSINEKKMFKPAILIYTK